jgi:hypothetical protein
MFAMARAAVPKALTLGASLAAAPMAMAGQGKAQPVQIIINIDARGATPGVAQDIEKAIDKAMPHIEKRLAVLQEAKARSSNSGR